MTGRAMCLSYCGLRIAERGLIVDCGVRSADRLGIGAEIRNQSAIKSALRTPQSALRRLAEEDFSEVVLQEERVGDAQPGKQPDDVAVEQDRLASAQRRVRPVLQVHFVDDDELGVASVARRGGAEEAEQ